MITILDYNMGNLGSIYNMLKKIGFKSIITNDKEKIWQASKIILPGVGSFDHAMKNLKELDMISILDEKAVGQKTPILGICLGLQIMAKSSSEGKLSGLGWIDAHVEKFPSSDLPIPHMGWNYIYVKKENPLIRNLDENARFYFVHSYYFSCNKKEDVLSESLYGITFTSSIARENIFGVQFHPEKSHKYGMNVLQNFAELN